MKKIFLIIIALSFMTNIKAQSIRKNYLEMTPSEQNDYVSALQDLYTDGTIKEMAEHHGEHFNTNIHSVCAPDGENFLPWHRFFLLDFEEHIHAKNPTSYNYLSIPYWDWRTDPGHNAYPQLADFAGSANFWGHSDKVTTTPSFLALSKFPGWTTDSYTFEGCNSTAQITTPLTRAYENNTFGRLPLTIHISDVWCALKLWPIKRRRVMYLFDN